MFAKSRQKFSQSVRRQRSGPRCRSQVFADAPSEPVAGAVAGLVFKIDSVNRRAASCLHRHADEVRRRELDGD